MSWNLYAYLEVTDKEGKWHLVSERPFLSECKSVLEWDELDYIEIGELSEELVGHWRSEFLGCTYTSHSETDWERRKMEINLKCIDLAGMSYMISELDKGVDRAYYAAFCAMGVPYPGEDDDVYFYEGKYDDDDRIRPDWNPMTYPVNKDLLYELAMQKRNSEKANRLLGMETVMRSLTRSWTDENGNFRHGDARLIVEMS